jgi:hypothetical protein
MQWSDALGKSARARYPGTPRIVSLVPSLTELLVDLGLAEAAGRSHRFLHPSAAGRPAGSRSSAAPRASTIDKLRVLQPTHVLVNIDENRREEVEASVRLRSTPDRHPSAGRPRQPRPCIACWAGIFKGETKEAAGLVCRLRARMGSARALLAKTGYRGSGCST